MTSKKGVFFRRSFIADTSNAEHAALYFNVDFALQTQPYKENENVQIEICCSETGEKLIMEIPDARHLCDALIGFLYGRNVLVRRHPVFLLVDPMPDKPTVMIVPRETLKINVPEIKVPENKSNAAGFFAWVRRTWRAKHG